MTIPYLKTNNGVTIILEGKHHMIDSSFKKYDLVLDALRAEDVHTLKDLLDPSQKVSRVTNGMIIIENGVVYYDGKEFHDALTQRMLECLDLGLDISPLCRFMERLQRNPSYRSREQLFQFLDACDLPILADGRFLAYKSVNQDYWDTHTGKTYLNTPGAVIRMDRTDVDDDPNRTCSAGLHVCSQAYGMYGSRLLHVAVDPAHVVSVPKEYHMAKMRVCQYEVLQNAEKFEEWSDKPVLGEDEDYYSNIDAWDSFEDEDL